MCRSPPSAKTIDFTTVAGPVRNGRARRRSLPVPSPPSTSQVRNRALPVNGGSRPGRRTRRRDRGAANCSGPKPASDLLRARSPRRCRSGSGTPRSRRRGRPAAWAHLPNSSARVPVPVVNWTRTFPVRASDVESRTSCVSADTNDRRGARRDGIAGCRCLNRSSCDERRSPGGRPVPDSDYVSLLDQRRCKCTPHRTESDNGDIAHRGLEPN